MIINGQKLTPEQEKLIVKILFTYRDIVDLVTQGEWKFGIDGSDFLVLPQGTVSKINELIVKKNTLGELL
jgi:hypothetical protein